MGNEQGKAADDAILLTSASAAKGKQTDETQTEQVPLSPSQPEIVIPAAVSPKSPPPRLSSAPPVLSLSGSVSASASPLLPSIRPSRSLSPQTSAVIVPVSPVWAVDRNEHRSLICRFCGGASCKKEDYTKQHDRENAAIIGLHSNYITDEVIAMQRPSTRLIRTHNIVRQFVEQGIRAIINLQIAGEHSLCGDGIHAHGFSYHCDDLPNTRYYAFGWMDFGVPTLERMMNIVQVMQYHAQRGEKIAVHCHAGYGRTGMAIACFLVFHSQHTAEQAIQIVRKKREGSVETKEQKRFICRFEQYVTSVRAHFILNEQQDKSMETHSNSSSQMTSPSIHPLSHIQIFSPRFLTAVKSPSLPPLSPTPALPPSLSFPLQPLTLSHILTNQRIYLHGHERAQYRYVSKLISCITDKLTGQHDELCRELLRRKIENKDLSGGRDNSNHSSSSSSSTEMAHIPCSYDSTTHTLLPFDFVSSWSVTDAEDLYRLKQRINHDDYTALAHTSLFLCLVLLIDLCASLATPLIPFFNIVTTTASSNRDLPTSIQSTFTLIPKSHLPSLDLIASNVLMPLYGKAIMDSSSPLSNLVLLGFAFALLHPPYSAPMALHLHPLTLSMSASAALPEPNGAQLDALLAFMSMLVRGWSIHYAAVQKQEEDERIKRKVGVKVAEHKWWLGVDSVHGGTTDSAPDGIRQTDSNIKDMNNEGKVMHEEDQNAAGSRSRPRPSLPQINVPARFVSKY